MGGNCGIMGSDTMQCSTVGFPGIYRFYLKAVPHYPLGTEGTCLGASELSEPPTSISIVINSLNK
jgi:hypothetical protein